MKGEIRNVEDLEVYRKLCELHLQLNEISLKFPKYELYELGSQIRRSSNSIAANIAEGWNNKHINIYLESINRAQGELQETKHHLYIAYRKKYLSEELYREFFEKCNECGRMLRGLEQSLLNWKSKIQHLSP
jgi:four helix bundle protein